MATMTVESALVTLFQGPFDDASITDVALARGYRAIFADLRTLADEVDAIVPTTADLAERQVAADLLVTSAMCACYSAMCEAFAALTIDADKSSFHDVNVGASGDYTIFDDVERDLALLNDAWEILMGRSVDADVRAQLLEIKIRTDKLLQDLAISLPRIEVFDVPAMPASVLAYLLYDTPDRQVDLIKLNLDAEPTLYDGPHNILVI